ncbi:hypothetical protein PSm6_44210 [Pseudomonas solani]|uniref:Uncharacterized protein n=1 Tax=Pseudomonas solani TaxID=2731552 RepID=A0ABM7LEI5_9PSED|nr:hypothetical protein [Pseudomonas solani]BCD88014.1 hypothetical protein PSm6_44210 [Pseudomonas solani]
MSDVIELPMSVTVSGRRWNLFTYDYTTPDGTFSGYLYAISAEHAAALLSEMKETAELKGQMVGVIE